MTDVFPPPPAPPPAVSTNSLPQTAVAHNPPSNIASLPIGASVSGVVTAQTTQSTLVEIDTHLGKLLIQSTVDLKLDNYLQLILQKKSPHLQFIIRNNFPTGTDHTLNSPSGTAQIETSKLQDLTATRSADPTLTSSTSAEGQVKVEIGVVVRATLLTAYTAQDLSNLSTAPASTAFPDEILHAGGQVLRSIKNGFARVFNGHGAGSATKTPSHLASTLTAGSKLDVRITDILSPATGMVNSRSKLSLKPGQVFLGTVTSHLPSGFPVTDTPVGRLVLETVAHIARGSRLSLEFVTLPQGEGLNNRPNVNVMTPLLSRDLPAITETLDFIEQLPSEVRGSVPIPAIPRADSQLTATLLFFLSALKGGNANTWLPDQTKAFLNAERPDLLGRLNDEFGQIARPFNEGTSGDWRTALIPLIGGSYLENFQMSFRKGGGGGAVEDDEEGARFIVDVTLSKFGRVQLDGLVISGKNKFDLFVRSEASFSKMMRNGIIKIFYEFIEISGVKGNLLFQSQAHFVDVPRVHSESGKDAHLVI